MSKKRVMRMRCTEKEVISFNERAAKAKMTPTSYMRSLLFPKRVVATTSAPAEEPAPVVATKAARPKKDKKTVATKVTPQASKVLADKPDNSYRRFAEPGALLKK